MVKENLYNVFKCFSNKALKYRAYTHLCNTSSLVTVVETAMKVNYGDEAALIFSWRGNFRKNDAGSPQ